MKNFSTQLLLVCCFVSEIGLHAQTAQDEPYVKEMPKADQVRAAIQGTNSVDTDARLVGAFYQLSQMLQVVVPVVGLTDFNNPNPVREEQEKIRGIYDRAWRKVADARSAEFGGNGRGYSERGEEWKHLYTGYMQDENLREQLLKSFFSPKWQAKYRSTVKAERDELESQAIYVKGMPTVERVLAAIQGTNTLDREARQVAAFRQLTSIMQTMMTEQRYYHGKRAPSEGRLYVAYEEAARKIEAAKFVEWGRLVKDGKRIRESDLPQLAEWTHLWKTYESDEGYRQEILKLLFTPEWQASYAAVKGQEMAQHEQWRQQDVAKEEAKAEVKRKETRETLRVVLIPVVIIGFFVGYALLMWIIGLGLKGAPQAVTGRIVSLGQSQLFMEQGLRYSMVKIETAEGKEQTLSSVLVGNDLEGEFAIRAEGTFVFYRSHNCMVLCGCNVDGKVSIGAKEFDPTTKSTRLAKIVGVLCQILGLLTAVIFGLGFLVMAMGLYYSVRGISRRPKTAAIKTALDKAAILPLIDTVQHG